MSLFIGRNEELRLLRGLSEKQSASLVVIYGRRRVVLDFTVACLLKYN